MIVHIHRSAKEVPLSQVTLYMTAPRSHHVAQVTEVSLFAPLSFVTHDGKSLVSHTRLEKLQRFHLHITIINK
jgi:hypothetical protein